MSVRGAMMSAMWTEIREAINEDWPEIKVPNKAGPKLSKVIGQNADYILELNTGLSQ